MTTTTTTRLQRPPTSTWTTEETASRCCVASTAASRSWSCTTPGPKAPETTRAATGRRRPGAMAKLSVPKRRSGALSQIIACGRRRHKNGCISKAWRILAVFRYMGGNSTCSDYAHSVTSSWLASSKTGIRVVYLMARGLNVKTGIDARVEKAVPTATPCLPCLLVDSVGSGGGSAEPQLRPRWGGRVQKVEPAGQRQSTLASSCGLKRRGSMSTATSTRRWWSKSSSSAAKAAFSGRWTGTRLIDVWVVPSCGEDDKGKQKRNETAPGPSLPGPVVLSHRMDHWRKERFRGILQSTSSVNGLRISTGKA